MRLARPALFAVLALVLAAPALAQESAAYEGWQVWAPPGVELEGVGYQCVGDDCANQTLACVHFALDEAVPPEADLALLLTDQAPWGQIDFWAAAQLVGERTDILPSPDAVTNSARQGPFPATANGVPYVSVSYAIAAGDTQIMMPIAMWIREGQLQGLRCSYRVEGLDPKARIDGLVAQILQP